MRALIVDDHPIFLDGLSQRLEQLDPEMEIEQAMSVGQALERIRAGPRPEFLLIDIVLPDCSGVSLLQQLAGDEIRIPTLVLSGKENPDLIPWAIDAGAMGFVSRTYSAEQLLDAIRRVLGGDLFLPPGIAEQIDRRLGEHREAGSGAGEVVSEHGIARRQTEVLNLMKRGYSNKKIDSTLFVSEHTVKSQVKAMFKALKVGNRTACVRKAEQLGLVESSPRFSD